ncbi:MAG TPA: hypothetical protein ENK20_06240, partial [Chromatiales bacterium]|nr:hypothetical protein [Chromatiales bacterium]
MGNPGRARRHVVAAAAAGTVLAGVAALAVVGEIPVQREGRPVPGATVTLFGPKGEKVGEGRTDERGVAVIPDLPRPPDELVVAAAKDDKIAMRPPRMPSTATTATDRPARPAREPAVTVSRDGLITVRPPGSDTDLVFRLGPTREPPPEPVPPQPRLAPSGTDAAPAEDLPPADRPAVTVSRDGLITVRPPGSDIDLVFRLGPTREPPPEPVPPQPRLAPSGTDAAPAE